MEHWCWAGYNSKGKWGIFPQSYIEPNTIHEAPSSPDSTSLKSGSAARRFFSVRTHKSNNSSELRRNPIY
jgi:hypothetical protein